MNDSFKHKGLRKRLIQTIKSKGISNKSVLSAISKVPRHLFMDSGFIDHAYQDKAFPISANQTISQPFTVAFQTELLKLKKGDKVLEVGTGSGYQAAVLCELGANVYTIERQGELYKKVVNFLPSINYYPKKIIYGDGYKGLEEESPFDSIIVTAGAPLVPKALLNQLKIGGRLVIPLGENIQIMTLYVKISDDNFDIKEYGEFQFVPLLKEKE
ncbi:MAG TPA: protein-L-isoaspartate(D-aspartate) O-methyltransferase [Flavobacteriaceae bacterium]|nr:protein-L-isoaspartate(D-aspartate) O-methyltransferase [Flavobacteriaceae bacterium]